MDLQALPGHNVRSPKLLRQNSPSLHGNRINLRFAIYLSSH